MKTLYIAEKPDMASCIAEHLWQGETKRLRGEHAYKKGDTIVTWSFGHMLQNCMPADYGEQYKDYEVFPIFPKEWQKKIKADAMEHYKAVAKMLKDADIVVNGGDPDREGQLLIDEILEKEHFTGKVLRILINAKDDVSVKKAFDNITDNENFRNLYHAGLARERADWLVGMNLSRAYAKNAKRHGVRGVWKIGRVKAAFLSLAVQREKEIENFRPVDYFDLVAKLSKDGVPFTAHLRPNDSIPTDSQGRVLNRQFLEETVKGIEEKQCKVTMFERKQGQELAPLPYSIATLQTEANRRYNLPIDKVLAIVQALYEKKLVSYPRSDCEYLPVSQHRDAERVLSALGLYGISAAKTADITIKGKAFNDRKISAHHAIVPTGVVPKELSEAEKKVYDMIALRYFIQFYPPCTFEQVKYTVEIEGNANKNEGNESNTENKRGNVVFSGSGKTITNLGWKAVIKGNSNSTNINDSNTKDEESDLSPDTAETSESSSLPQIKVGDVLPSPTFTIETKQTQKPKRFNEGTLLEASTKIWNYIEPDNPNRELLKECKGIGTPATRAAIIADMQNGNDTPLLAKQGKDLVPTPFGRYLCENLDVTLTKPDFTAEMECKLTDIAEGRLSISKFLADVESFIEQNIKYAESHEFKPLALPPSSTLASARASSAPTKGDVGGKSSASFRQSKSKICPDCGGEAKKVHSKKTGKDYWLCPACDKFLNDYNNKGNSSKTKKK